MCDLLPGHKCMHEYITEHGESIEWPLEEEVKRFEWAAGLNPNPFKIRPALRALSSDHNAVTPCSRGTECVTESDEFKRQQRLHDKRRNIDPMVG